MESESDAVIYVSVGNKRTNLLSFTIIIIIAFQQNQEESLVAFDKTVFRFSRNDQVGGAAASA